MTARPMLNNLTGNQALIQSASDEPVIPLDYVIAVSAGARKLSDFISDRLFVQMTVKRPMDLASRLPPCSP